VLFARGDQATGRDLDLYVSRKTRGGNWGEPVSLGGDINSPQHEQSRRDLAEVLSRLGSVLIR